MNFSQDILMVLLLSTIAQGTGTELATNTNFLLLLLLALNGQNSSGCGFGCNNGCSSCGGRFF